MLSNYSRLREVGSWQNRPSLCSSLDFNIKLCSGNTAVISSSSNRKIDYIGNIKGISQLIVYYSSFSSKRKESQQLKPKRTAMPEFTIKLVLSDIEGTTTSISFVKNVLFPYSKAHTKSFLEETWTNTDTQSIVQDLRNLSQYKEYFGSSDDQSLPSAGSLANFVNFLIDKDLKLGPLKTLQGLVWAKGYSSGNIKGHIYADVPAAFKLWYDAGIRIAIYSSGSVKAQKLLFEQTELGNLLGFISAHYDTAVGHKQEKESYVNIAKDLGLASEDVLFLTDVVKEAEAARDAGMQVVLLNRPGNAPLTDDDKSAFTVVDNFDSIKLILK